MVQFRRLTSLSNKSLRTVIPYSVVKKLNLTPSDLLEWVEKKGDIIVKKL